MSFISRPTSLGEIANVDAFVRDGLRRGLRSCRGTLDGDDLDDALDFLRLELYELRASYDPTLNSSFTKYAYPLLPLRLVDWYRKNFGDRRYRERPVVCSLDEYRERLTHREQRCKINAAVVEEMEARVAFSR